jgi:PhzF family phenazine biosynthesis protein
MEFRMPTISVIMMQSFVDGNAGGNAAGLVFPADHLSLKEKQVISAKVGVSETAFISASSQAAYKLDFFTPTKQIAHCGHATIATFCYLSQIGKLPDGWTSKETIDGNRKILISDGMAYMEQKAPVYTAIHSKGIQTDRVLRSVALTTADLLPGKEPLLVYTGNTYLIVPVKDQDALKSIQPDDNEIKAISETLNIIGYYAFTPEASLPGRDAAARMFAPFFGIREESATGTGVGPCTCYMYDHLQIKQNRIVVEQGKLMTPPSPSILYTDFQLEDGRITGLLVGGKAIQSGTKTIEY